MVQINFLMVLGLLGLLVGELTKAVTDNKITLAEGIDIIRKVCSQLGIEFDMAGVELPASFAGTPTPPTTTTTTTTTG